MKIIHVWQHGGKLSPETARRNAVARATWEKVYASGNWVERRLDDNVLTRTANTVVPGEARDYPFIHDLIRYACFGSPNDQIICLSNADTCFASNIEERAMQLFQQGAKAIHLHRRDFQGEPCIIHDDEIEKGAHYGGSDCFFFSAGWWRKVVGEYPDFILSREAWDKILRELIKKHGGMELKNAIFHFRHESDWELRRLTCPSNIYCRNLARTWLKKNNLPLEELSFVETALPKHK